MDTFRGKVSEFIGKLKQQKMLSLLGILLLAAAIPTTIYVEQQQQDIRQHAQAGLTLTVNNVCVNGTAYFDINFNNSPGHLYSIQSTPTLIPNQIPGQLTNRPLRIPFGFGAPALVPGATYSILIADYTDNINSNTVQAVGFACPVITMSLNPQSFTAGASTTLSWSSTNLPAGTTCTNNWDSFAPNITPNAAGSRTFGNQSSSHAFTITCSDGTTQSVSTNVTARQPITGYLGDVDCTHIEGWAYDPNNPGTPINVRIRRNGQDVATVPASGARDAGSFAACQNHNCGYSYAIPAGPEWESGTQNIIQAYGIDPSNNQLVELQSSSRPLLCAAPTQPPATPVLTAANQCVNGSPGVHMTWTNPGSLNNHWDIDGVYSGSAGPNNSAMDWNVAIGSHSFDIRAQSPNGTPQSNTVTVSITACPQPVNATWSDWSACSASCGTGTQTRSCTAEGQNGGRTCAQGPADGAGTSRACPNLPPCDNPPQITAGTISAANIVPNTSTPYTITLTGSDADGASDIGDMYSLINYNGGTGPYRGYVGWSLSGKGWTTWWTNSFKSTPMDCTGGGKAAIYGGAGGESYGKDYINLISCTTSTSGNSRTVSFVVTFNPNFATPTTNNVVDVFMADTPMKYDGWKHFGTFAITPVGTLLAFDVTLGSLAGQNAPKQPQRPLNVEIFNSSNQLVGTAIKGTITLASSSGKFTGSVGTGTALAAGNYTMVIQTPQYLKKRIPAIISVAASQTTVSLPPLSLVSGDLNGDNKVDVLDYGYLVDCYGQKANSANCSAIIGNPGGITDGLSKKTLADLNDDGVVDGVDVNLFIISLASRQGD